MARPATENFILEKLREVGIVKEDEAKLNQVYTGYETDDTQYRIVFKSYLIDYYCAVLTDQERVKKLEVPAVFDAATLGNIQAAIKESSINKEMLQSYLEKKRLSCERAKTLGFSEAETQCLTYIQNLEEFLAYVPESNFIVDVSFVKTIDSTKYDEKKVNQLIRRSDLTFYLETDLPKHSVHSSLSLEEAKELVEYQSKIDELKTKGGFAISFGNGRDGYETSFKILKQFIEAGWKITKVEMLYPDKITFTSITKAPQQIKGILSDMKEHTIDALEKIVKNESLYTLNESNYFNGTMLTTLERDTQILTIWTLASREDFHDIAIQKSLVAIFKDKKVYPYQDPMKAIIATNKDSSHITSFMRQSIYTTDLYHLLRYAIESNKRKQSEKPKLTTTFDFYAQTTSDYLYPSKITSFKSKQAIDKAIKFSPAIIIDLFRTALTTTGASKVHLFATLPDQSTPSDSLTIKIMKLIAYANRLKSNS
jgi:hypothetical protein